MATLSPDDIRNVQLPYTRGHSLGLDEVKVRNYLEQCAAALDEAQREIETLRRQVIDPENQRHTDQAVAMLSIAQRVADETVADAQAYSQQVVTEAQGLAGRVRSRISDMATKLDGVIVKVTDELLSELMPGSGRGDRSRASDRGETPGPDRVPVNSGTGR